MKKFTAVTLALMMVLTCLVSVAFAADGWQKNADGEWQYLENGSPVTDKWISTGGKWYYLDADGIMIHDGFVKYGGKTYYLTEGGSMLDKGWKPVRDAEGDYWIYAKAGGELVQKDWLKDKGKWYWFDENGVMVTGLMKIDDVWYAFKDSGAMADGEWFQETQYGFGLWFYANPGGALAKGWKKINGKWYYFSDKVPKGSWDAPWMYNYGEAEIDGKYYVLNKESGEMLTGWVNLLKQNYTYSILPELWAYYGEDGARRAGWVHDNGKWYYMGANGTYLYRNCVATVDDVRYAFGKTGAIPEGWYKTPAFSYGDGGQWVYSTVNGIKISEWIQDGNDWYYVDENGYMVTGEKEIQGKVYKFDSNGKWIK